MIQPVERPARKAFRDRYLAVAIAVLAFFFTGDVFAQDAGKYSKINGYGFLYKRMGFDSVALMPLSSSAHLPYRMGGYRYNESDSSIDVWTGTQWIKDNKAKQLNDSMFVVGSDTITIRGTGGGGGGSYTGPFNAAAVTGDTLVNSDKELKRLEASYGLTRSATGTVVTHKVDTTGSNGIVPQPRLRDTAAALRAVSYYVAQSGLSSGEGSTPATAISMARLMTLSANFTGRERIYFHARDTLRGQLTVKSGTYIGRYDTGAAPIVAGTIRSNTLTWTQDGVVWSASYPTRVGRVLRNGIPEKNAQSAYHEVTSHGGGSVTAPSAAGLGGWVTAAELVAKEYNFRWKYTTISAYNSGTGEVTPTTALGMANGFNFKFINHPNLITADGDWAWVSGTVYYRSPGNVNPNTLNVEIGVYDNGLVLDGSHITVEGITFYAQALDGVKANNNDVIIKNCNFYKQFDAGVYLTDNIGGVSITNCKFDSIGNSGVVGGGIKDFRFVDLSFHKMGMGLEPPYSRQTGLLRNGNTGYGVALFPNSDRGFIERCVVDSVAYIGIRADASNTLVRNNKISHFSFRQNDGGGIYTWGNEAFYFEIYGWKRPRNIVISNNLVYGGAGINEGGPDDDDNAFGIYLDNGTYDTYVYGNACYDNTNAGIYTGWDTRNIEMVGNTLYNNHRSQILIGSNTNDGLPATTQIKVKNNYLVSINPDQYGVEIYDAQSGGHNPFDNGGYCTDNVFVSPYTNDLVLRSDGLTPTEYDLSEAQDYYEQGVGQQDVFSTSYVDDNTSKTYLLLDVNETVGTRLSVVPDSCRNPLNKLFDPFLGPYNAAVFVKDTLVGGGGGGSAGTLDQVTDLGATTTNNITVGQLSSDATVPGINWKQSAITKALIAVSAATNQVINGSAAGDFCYRTAGGKMIFSTDIGTTPHLAIDGSGNVGIGTASPAYFVDATIDANSGKRFNIRNTNSGSSAGAMFQALNDADYGLQTGVVSSTYSSGMNGNNDVFFQANTQPGSSFNIMSVNTGPIRFGQFISGSVQEVARFYSGNGNFLIGSTTDNGAKLQVNGDATVTDEAYDATAWNGSLEVPTKNALRDKIESLGGGSLSGSGTSGQLALWNGTSSFTGNSNILWGTSNGPRISVGTTNTQGVLNIGGDKNLTSSGIQSYFAGATYTDAVTAASGTASSYTINYIGPPTIAATNTSVTFPSITTLSVDAPTAGTNATITNRYAFQTGSNGHAKIQGNLEVDAALLAGGAQYNAVTTISADATLSTSVYWVRVNAASGNVTITLPAASTVFTSGRGISYIFVRIDNSLGNTVTIQRAGSDTIESGTSFTLTSQWDKQGLQCTSTSTWEIQNL